jgi:hypothetical protein
MDLLSCGNCSGNFSSFFLQDVLVYLTSNPTLTRVELVASHTTVNESTEYKD